MQQASNYVSVLKQLQPIPCLGIETEVIGAISLPA